MGVGGEGRPRPFALRTKRTAAFYCVGVNQPGLCGSGQRHKYASESEPPVTL